MTDVTERQMWLLHIVNDGGGEGDARSIDLAMSVRYGPSQTTVRSELLALALTGLVEVDDDRGVGGTWSLTPLGRDILESDQME